MHISNLHKTKIYLVVLKIYLAGAAISCAAKALAQGVIANEAQNIFSFPPKERIDNIRYLIKRAAQLKHVDRDSSFLLYRSALQESYNSSYEEGIVNISFRLSDYYCRKGLYDSSISINLRIFRFCRQESPSKGNLVRLYNNLAQANFFKGEFSAATQFNYKALYELYKGETRNPELAIITYTLTARPLSLFGDHKTALKFLEFAEYLALRSRKERLLSHIYSDLATIYYNQKIWQKSYEYCRRVLSINPENCDGTAYVTAASTLAYICILHKEKQKALLYARKAFKKSETIKESGAGINALIALGYACYCSKNYRQAVHYLKKGLREAERTGGKQEMANCHGLLANIYRDRKRFKEALYHQEIYNNIKDSLWSRENIESLHKIRVNYDLIRKNATLTEKQLLITSQNNTIKDMYIWIICISSGCLIIVILSIFKHKKEIFIKSLQSERISNLQHKSEILEQEQEIALLKAMMKGGEKERARLAIELHDGVIGQLSIIKTLFNAFQNRYPVLDHAVDYKDAVQQFDDTILELRKITHNLIPEILLQEGLYDAVHLFCDRISQATGVQINVSLSGIMPPLDPDTELSIYRIIQELVQNIVKHAHATKALVHFTYHAGTLGITIEDNGSGFNKYAREGYSGMGLKNINTRINALQGNFEMTNNSYGTSVYIDLNITQ